MTFHLTLADSIAGQRLYRRSRNRFDAFTPGFIGLLALLFGWYARQHLDVKSAALTLYMASFLVYNCLWRPLRLKTLFRRQYGGDQSPPITFEFSAQGLMIRASKGESVLAWENFKGRLEGRDVWVFLLGGARQPGVFGLGRKEKTYLLVLPKSATQTPEGAREWAVVDAHFALPASRFGAHRFAVVAAFPEICRASLPTPV